MKLSELEERARQERGELEERARQERDEAAALAAEQVLEEQIAAAEATEEFRQKAIAWMVKEGDLDATELGATLSVVDHQYRRLKLSLPEHTAISFQAKMEGGAVVGVRDDRFAVKNASGGTHYWNNLGYALLAASEEWDERINREAEKIYQEREREKKRELRDRLAAERGAKYLDVLEEYPILRPILDILAAFLEEREQFAEDLERAEEFSMGVEARYQQKLEQAQQEADRLESERSRLQSDLYDAEDRLSRKCGRGW